jgi:hypothetical protein
LIASCTEARAELSKALSPYGLAFFQKLRRSSLPPISGELPIEHARRDRGLVAGMDVLSYVGRAIAPSHSTPRFNTRGSALLLGKNARRIGVCREAVSAP